MEILLNMIEIFSRNPDFIILEDDAVLTSLLIDDEISSLSAILLNEAYYELLKTGQKMVDGIPVLSPTCLIPFKVKAWLDLKECKLNGDQVDSKNIKKHKNDVFRLALLITANGYTLSARSIENLLAVGYNEIENICVQRGDE